MTRPTDEELLAFLEGAMGTAERSALLEALDTDPELAERLRAAASGLDALRSTAAHADADAATDPSAPGAPARTSPRTEPRRVSPWWAVASAAAALVISVPTTLWLANSGPTGSSDPVAATSGDAGPEPVALPAGAPQAPAPSFVVVLHGRWPDAATVTPDEARSRGQEYWAWTSSLAREGLLVAAGDLRWEPGRRLGPGGELVQVAASEVERDEYLVGMFALRVGTYEEALAVARECPHLRYGGSVSVRRVAAGFVTVEGMSDWSD